MEGKLKKEIRVVAKQKNVELNKPVVFKKNTVVETCCFQTKWLLSINTVVFKQLCFRDQSLFAKNVVWEIMVFNNMLFSINTLFSNKNMFSKEVPHC